MATLREQIDAIRTLADEARLEADHTLRGRAMDLAKAGDWDTLALVVDRARAKVAEWRRLNEEVAIMEQTARKIEAE